MFYKQKFLTKSFLVGLFICCFFYSKAQKLNYRIDHYGTEMGLSQGSVFAMLRDSRGTMWFGTQDGLNKWDGENFTTFRPSKRQKNSVNGIEIKKIIEDDKGDLWIGTENSLNHYRYISNDFETFFTKNSKNEIVKNEVFPIKATNGVVWYWSDAEGLVKLFLKSQKKQIVLPNKSFNTNYFRTVNSTQFDAFGKLWIHTTDAVIRLDTSTKNIDYFFSNHPKNKAGKPLEIIKILPVDKLLWIATSDGLVSFNFLSNEIQYINEFEKNKPIQLVFDLDTDQKGSLWLATEKHGLLRYSIDNQDFIQIKNESYLGKNNLFINEVSQVYVDYDGIIWANTDPYGIDRIQLLPGNLSSFRIPFPENFPKELLNYSVRFILKDEAKNQLILGTQQSGLWIINDKNLSIEKSFYNDEKHSPLPSNTIRFLKQDSSKNIWIGTSQGLAFLKNQSITKVNNPYGKDRSLSNFIRYIEDDKNDLLLGTEAGIYFLDKRKKVIKNKVVFQDKRISLIKKITDNQYFIGFYNGGLCEVITTNNFDNYTVKQIIPDGIPICVKQSKADFSWWIGTSNGLYHYFPKTNKKEAFTTEDGLPNNFIYACEIDKNQQIWVSTNRGLARYDVQQKRFTSFNLNDGLQAYEFNDYSSLQTPNGELFFGGVNGLNRFYPDDITKSKQTPDFVLSKEKTHQFVANKCLGFVDELDVFKRPNIENAQFMSSFKPILNDIPNYGYANKSIWLMMRVMNLADKKWLLEIENSRVNEVDLFVLEHNRIINSKKQGDHFPYQLSPIKDANPIFKIDMIENQEYLIFLRFKSTEDLKFPINFWQESELFQQISTRKIIWGIYFGFILLIALYNLFLWIVIRDNSLIYYIFYVLCFGALQAVLYGFFYQYIWSNSWLNDRFHLVFLNFSSFFMIYFTIEFLNFKTYIPQIIIPVKAFSLVFLLFSFSLLLHYDWYSNFIGIALTFLLLTLQLSVVYVYFSHKIRIIRYYALAMVSISIAGIIVGLKNLNIVSAMNQEYYLMVGSMLEIVLFSVAFGDKLRQSQKEQQRQQRIRNEISTNLHDDLAASLSSLTMYSELSRQRASKQSPEIASRFDTISQKSREILRLVREVVWDINPSNDQSEEWLERIIAFARDVFDSKQIDLQIDVDANAYQVILPVLERREVYLIFKEAINNIARHSEATEVKFLAEISDKNLIISILDNGKGFNEEAIRKGNGLENLQKRADKIKAKLVIKSKENEGAEVQLVLNH